MVRILSKMTPAHIRAMLKEAKYPDPRLEEFILLRLLQRRQRIFEEYLTEYVPLANFAPKDAPDDHPLRYGVLDIFVHQTKSVRPSSSIEVHFYDLGEERGFRLVGVERPPEVKVPNLY